MRGDLLSDQRLFAFLLRQMLDLIVTSYLQLLNISKPLTKTLQLSNYRGWF